MARAPRLTGFAATFWCITVAASMPDQCTKRQVNHGANTAIDSRSRPTSMSENDRDASVACPVPARSGPVPENADAPTTKTTTMTSLENTSAATISSHRRVHTRVWSHTDPAKATGANTAMRMSAALRNSSTPHSSKNPTHSSSPMMSCMPGDCAVARAVKLKNCAAAWATVVPAAEAIASQISSTADSAS